MLVKKINSEWQPSENKGLLVGETIEITDPKGLILSGMAVAIDENGVETSSYEMYGVLSKDEMDEYKNYMSMKKQEALKTKLEGEKADLEKQLAESKKEEAPKEEVKEEPKTEVKKK